MNPKLKKGLFIGGGIALAITLAIVINGKVKKARLNRPCKGKRCAKGIVGKTINIAGDRVNLRTQPRIDSDTLIGSIGDNPIGKVKKEVIGTDGYIWYQVELSMPYKGENEAYVREDVILIGK
jgi:hypothetical protein